MATTRYDVLVLGGGSAGLGAAMAARRQGASVGLIEASRLGGDCTWTGCVPSKTLIELAARHGEVRRITGAHDSRPDDVFGHVRSVISDIAQDDSQPVLEAMGIDVITGSAQFVSDTTVNVGQQTFFGSRIIIATGARPVLPPIPGLDSGPVLTTESVFNLRELPESLAVLGAGAVGVELSQAFARLGVRVELLELSDQILPREEPEASSAIAKALRLDGVSIHSGTLLEQCQWRDGAWRLDAPGATLPEVSALLVAVGRAADTDGLQLDAAGIERDNSGHIGVGPDFRTSVESVFAIGDVVNSLQFTHAAYEMARVAVRNALDGKARSIDEATIPYAIFTDPELARVGLTESAAAEKFNGDAAIALMPDAETDRGRITGRTLGFTKLISEPIRDDPYATPLLGATIVSPRAGEMIHEVALALSARLTVGDLIKTTRAYPTWSMSIGECAAQFVSRYKGRHWRPAELRLP